MAIQSLFNSGIQIGPVERLSRAFTGLTLDATGESAASIGHIIFADGTTGTKTFSAGGGGKLIVPTGTIILASAGTTVRMGVQDVDLTTGLEDAVFDVYADYVGGTDSMSNSTLVEVTMESGTKSISNGQLIALCVELMSKGGSDQIQLVKGQNTQLFPYSTNDFGIGVQKQSNTLVPFGLIFDDGTFGYFVSGLPSQEGSISVGVSSSPDEYAMLITPDFDLEINGISHVASGIASGDDFEIILYSDALGTPTAVETIQMDSDAVSSQSTQNLIFANFTGRHTLTAGLTYAIAIRPTSANGIVIPTVDFPSGKSVYRQMTPLKETWSLGSRSNQTGAFTAVTYRLPMTYLHVSGIPVASGGGGNYTFG